MKLFLKSLFFLAVIFHFSFFIFHLPKAFADTSCQPIYGGGQSCIATNNSITINKTVLNPKTNQFVDNLNINDPKYQPGFIATFQIAVTNTGNSKLSKVDVKDIFPQYVSFGSGAGTFDSKTNILSFSLTDLKPNETRKFGIVGRIFNANQISVTSGSVVCVANQAIAMIDGKNVSQDNAQFCIEKVLTKVGFPVFPVTPISKTPSTGPDSLILFSLIPTGIAGWFLRKKSKQALPL